jgi:SPP1 family phage portal protein
MELKEIEELLPGQFEELKRRIEQRRSVTDFKKLSDQYDPDKHAIHDNTKRQNKQVETENGAETIFVARLSIPLQKQIVRRAAAFLCGNPIKIDSEPQEGAELQLFNIVAKIWEDNKLDYDSKTLAKYMFSETQCAELWYWEKAEEDYWEGTANENILYMSADGQRTNGPVPFRLRMKILAPSKGDYLYPVKNSAGNMVAFARGWSETDYDGNEIKHFDIYTAQNLISYTHRKTTEGWVGETKPNPLKKIPIIYYEQEKPEWADVQHLIERLETLTSNHADTNDYNGSPSIVVKGKIVSFAKKGEQGKVIEIDPGGDIDYLSWDSAPESIKMEFEHLMALIFDMTDTPNISFDQVKGLGAYSGIALKMIFMAAHLKASDHEENFGKSIQRRLNLLKAAAITFNNGLRAAIQLKMKPKFEYYIPKDDVEAIQKLGNAVTYGIMSKETAIRQNPLIKDGDAEVAKVDAEEEKIAAREAANIIPV